jgi:hypothetical protein
VRLTTAVSHANGPGGGVGGGGVHIYRYAAPGPHTNSSIRATFLEQTYILGTGVRSLTICFEDLCQRGIAMRFPTKGLVLNYSSAECTANFQSGFNSRPIFTSFETLPPKRTFHLFIRTSKTTVANCKE